MSINAPESFSLTSRIRYDECGAGGVVRASVYVRLLQEMAFEHSAACGYPPEWNIARGLFWLARRVRLVVEAPARHGDALVCTTRLLGARRILARRLGTVRRGDNDTPVATAVVDWILTQNGTTPVRIPEDVAASFPGMERTVAPLPLEEPSPPAGVPEASLWVRTSDADAMAHANHPVYLDLLDDAVFRAGGGQAIAALPRTYDLQYHAAAPVGAPLRDLAWAESSTWHYRLVTPEGRLILHGRLATSA
ncbi:MAG: acyl-[acyl-carrier-protein] thioesterase [bacterium]|nr:acyl-[acyl-carrier-protein] thioesterase [bacterium]